MAGKSKTNGKEKEYENNALVQKSRPLFSLWKEKEKINLFEYKMLDKYLSKINSHDPQNRIVTFSMEDINEIMPSHLSKTELHDKLKKMQGLVVSYGEDEAVTLFEYSKIRVDEDTFDVQLMCTQTAHKFFFNVESIGYFKYKFRNILELSSMYSYILFNYLEMNRFRKQPFEVELSELKHILGCDTPTYDEFKHFNYMILKKCYNEITDKTELQYSYEAVRENRAVKYIRFNVTPSKQLEEIVNSTDEIEAVAEEIEEKSVTSDTFTENTETSEPDIISGTFVETETPEVVNESDKALDERMEFFSECFDGTFNVYQIRLILANVNTEMVGDSQYGKDIARYDYLDKMYRKLVFEEHERKITNRFKYFLSMIKNDKMDR